MILIICNSPHTAVFWRRHFFAVGIPTVAISYRAALKGQFDDALYDGALLPSPEEDSKPPRFCYSFHSHCPKLPIAMLTQKGVTLTKDMRDADIRLCDGHTPHHIISHLLFEISAYHHRDICDCIRGIYRDHLMESHSHICDTPIHLTPTERMIFRYLLYTYPRAITSAELHRNCIKPGTTPSIANIFSHIYRINYKSKQLIGYPIIAKCGGSAYRLNLLEE